jgi:hypothetical protein
MTLGCFVQPYLRELEYIAIMGGWEEDVEHQKYD